MRRLLTNLKHISLGVFVDGQDMHTKTDTGQKTKTHTGKYTGEIHNGNGKGKMIYNNKDIYDGDWKDGKMHGRGEFQKNVKKHGTFDWEFYGDFENNCPIRGALKTSEYAMSTQIDGEPGINIFDWDPYGTKRRGEGGELSAADAESLRKQIEEDANERISEASHRKLIEDMEARIKAESDKRAAEEWERLLHKKGG